MPEVSNKVFNHVPTVQFLGENGAKVSAVFSPSDNHEYAGRISLVHSHEKALVSENSITLTPLELKALRSLFAGDKEFPIWLALRNQTPHASVSAILGRLQKLMEVPELWPNILPSELQAFLKVLKGE